MCMYYIYGIVIPCLHGLVVVEVHALCRGELFQRR